MPYQITTPEFSFVRLSDQRLNAVDWRENQIPGSELGIILPVNHEDDVAFQVLVTTDTVAEADDICALPYDQSALIISPGAALPANPTFTQIQDALATPGANAGNFEELNASRFRISDTEIIYFFPKIASPSSLNCDQCFQIIFTLSAVSNFGPNAASNPFIYRCTDTDFTSVLDYYSERDEAGFAYCLGPEMKNRVRLPVYLTRPTYPDDEEIHRNSAGLVRIRKSQVRKLYEFVTDQFPNWAVESLRAVFMHDFVFIEANSAVPQVMNYEGQIVKEGSFEPIYVDYKNFPLATVNLKVNAVDYNLQKNNCGLCGDYSSAITTTDYFLSPVGPSATYIIDLGPLFDAGCCAPVSFVIDHYQTNYIANIFLNISGGVAGTFRDLHISTKPTLTFDPAQRPPFARVRVTCGGVSKFININSPLA
jgi:hypothetical protein